MGLAQLIENNAIDVAEAVKEAKRYCVERCTEFDSDKVTYILTDGSMLIVDGKRFWSEKKLTEHND